MINKILSQNLPLSTFHSTYANPPQIFPESQSFPQFFSKHLLHPNRRIKCFRNDPNAMIRAFYFQYLMLCYEIENQNYGVYIDRIKRFVLDENFTFLFLETDTDQIYNDLQFKRIILEFMEVLDSGEFPTTESALNCYPILDTVFVYFFRSLAIYAEITADFDSYVDKNIMFGFLLQNFGIDAQLFEEKCVKFIEAEVFVYEEGFEEVYMVYKDIQTSSSGIGQEGLDLGSQYSRESRENGVPIGGSQGTSEKQFREQYEQHEAFDGLGLYNVEGSVHENVSCLQEPSSEPVSSEKLGWKKDKGHQQDNTSKVASISSSNPHFTLNSPSQSPLPLSNQPTPEANNDYCLKLNGLSLSPSIDQLVQKQQGSDSFKTEAKNNSNVPSYSDPFVSAYEFPKNTPITNTITNTSSNVTVSLQNNGRDNDVKYPESISYLMNKDYGRSQTYGNANYHPSNNEHINKNSITSTLTKQGIQGPSKIETFPKQEFRHSQIPTRDISPMFPTLITTTIQSRESLTHRLPKIQQSAYASQGIGRQFREDSLRLGNKFRETVMAKLSVSKEFTDSWTLMKMGEPYRSNVRNIKARSRQFRQSIINSFH